MATLPSRPQSPQRLDEPLFVELLRRVAREVACYGDEIGALLVDLIYYSMQALGLRPVVEVDVTELDQPVAVELGCQPGSLSSTGLSSTRRVSASLA